MVRTRFGNLQPVFFLFFSFLGSYICVSLSFKGNYLKEIVLGWALSVIFNMSGLMIKVISLGSDIRRFFFYALILNSVNLTAFFLVIRLFLRKFPLAVSPFIVSVFVAYFIMLIYDIRTLRYAFPSQNKTV